MTSNTTVLEESFGHAQMRVGKLTSGKFRCQVRARDGARTKIVAADGDTPTEAIKNAADAALKWINDNG